MLADGDFALLWQQYDVEPKTRATKQFVHKPVGFLRLDFQTFNVAGAHKSTCGSLPGLLQEDSTGGLN